MKESSHEEEIGLKGILVQIKNFSQSAIEDNKHENDDEHQLNGMQVIVEDSSTE